MIFFHLFRKLTMTKATENDDNFSSSSPTESIGSQEEKISINRQKHFPKQF